MSAPSHGRPVLVAGLLLFAAGCAPDERTAPEALEASAVISVLATRADSNAALQTVARELALTLSDANIRGRLYDGLHRSRVREGKLHLQRFLNARGREFGKEVSRKNRRGDTGWPDAIKRLEGLEMYMPIASQRVAWQATPDLLVAAFLGTDEEIRAAGGKVTAYDSQGQAVELAYDGVPDQPVLVIYPAETDFGGDGETVPVRAQFTRASTGPAPEPTIIFPPGPTPVPQPSCDGNNPNGTLLYVCRSNIPDPSRYEGTLRGDPELAMALWSVVKNAQGNVVYGSLRTVGCINQDLGGASFYDQNGDWWFGRAFLASRAAIQTEQNTGRHLILNIWEDDSGSKCNFNPEGISSPANVSWSQMFRVSELMVLVGIGSGGVGGWALASVFAILGGVAAMFDASGDDIVGSAVIPGSVDPLSNPKDIRFNATTVVGSLKFLIK